MKTVVIRRFENYIKANIILQRLQNEGVSCFLQDEFTNTILPLYGNAVDGIKLAIPETEWDRTEALLAQFDEEYRLAATCPKCGANDISLVFKNEPGNYITAIVTWFFGSYSVGKKIYVCNNCSHQMEELPMPNESFNNQK